MQRRPRADAPPAVWMVDNGGVPGTDRDTSANACTVGQPRSNLTCIHIEIDGRWKAHGWVPLVFHEVCSQTYDPADYSYCTSSWAPIELDTFNALLDWLQNAGQPGGAPAGVVVQTVRQVVNGS